MSLALRGRNRYLTGIPSLIMVLVIYLPFTVPSVVQGFADSRLVVGIGAYLCLSLLIRHLWLGSRVPEWCETLWTAGDWFAWYLSSHLVHNSMPITLVAFVMVGEIAMVGWHRRSGVVHWTLASLATVLAPWFDPGHPPSTLFLVHWALPIIPGVVFVYVFINMAGRMAEQREAMARAHAVATQAQQEADRARRAAELANGQLREYARQVEELAVLRERNRLARDVHDTIAHGFTAIHMQMELIAALLQQNPAEAAALVVQVRDQVRDGLDEVRRSVHALRPLQMEEGEGVSALARLVNDFSRTTGVLADLAPSGTPRSLPAAHELCLYRAAQEGLTNAFRHGHAQRARVRIDYGADRVVLTVEDDGAGAPGPVTGGLGIVGIRERAAVLGGAVAAGTAPSGGFVLQVMLPLARDGVIAGEATR